MGVSAGNAEESGPFPTISLAFHRRSACFPALRLVCSESSSKGNGAQYASACKNDQSVLLFKSCSQTGSSNRASRWPNGLPRRGKWEAKVMELVRWVR
jgi:hypothetical protein